MVVVAQAHAKTRFDARCLVGRRVEAERHLCTAPVIMHRGGDNINHNADRDDEVERDVYLRPVIVIEDGGVDF